MSEEWFQAAFKEFQAMTMPDEAAPAIRPKTPPKITTDAFPGLPQAENGAGF